MEKGPGKSAEGVSANVVQAAPAPANEPPEFPSNTTSRNVDENTARGVNIGEPVAATDPNNDTLTYSLDVPSRATFNMVATTGRLQTKAALDYETGTHTYTVTVTATDPAGLRPTPLSRSPSPSTTSMNPARSRCRRCSLRSDSS